MASFGFTYGRDGGLVFLTEVAGRETAKAVFENDRLPQCGIIDRRALQLIPNFKTAALIVCDTERRSLSEDDKLSATIDHWRANNDDLLVLNRPHGPMRRYELLRTLHQNGVNKSNIFRLDDPSVIDLIRFPCFIRFENDHNINLPVPALIHSRDEFRDAVAKLRASNQSMVGRVAIEFEDLRDQSGNFVKMSYLRIGDRVMPVHRFVGRTWFLKYPDPDLIADDPTILEREREFISQRTFQKEIKEVFDLARIEYGRIDFAPTPDGKIQIFEINTNPNYPSLAHAGLRKEVIEKYHDEAADAFGDLIKGRTPVKLSWPREKYLNAIKRRITGEK